MARNPLGSLCAYGNAENNHYVPATLIVEGDLSRVGLPGEKRQICNLHGSMITLSGAPVNIRGKRGRKPEWMKPAVAVESPIAAPVTAHASYTVTFSVVTVWN